MRILVIGLNYLPESSSIGPYTAGLAGFLQKRGHKVRVVTGFPMAPQWRIWDGYNGKLFQNEVIDGVPIRRTYTYVPSNPRKSINRILFDASFSASAIIGALSGFRCDLVLGG